MNSEAITLDSPPNRSAEVVDAAHSGTDNRRRTHRIEQLIAAVDAFPDPAARELMQECLQSLLTMYGDGLARILQLTKNTGIHGTSVIDAFLRDKLVRSLLLVHNLHPESLEIRVRKALDTIRPYLQSHGGNVELISLENDVARLRLQGTCQSCPSSSVTLELAVRQTIEDACPDLRGFEVEGVAPASRDFIPHTEKAPHWTVLKDFDSVPTGSLRSLSVEDEPIVFCKPNGILYAYRNRCAICDAPFDSGKLEDHLLRCPEGHSFDVRRAGLSVDDARIHLHPFPLLATDGAVKVAVDHENPRKPKSQD